MTQFLRNRRCTSQSKRKFNSSRSLPSEYYLQLKITNVNRLPLTLQYDLTKDGLPVYSKIEKKDKLIKEVKARIFPLAVDVNKSVPVWHMGSLCMPEDLIKFTRKEEVTLNDGLLMKMERSSNSVESGMIMYRCLYYL